MPARPVQGKNNNDTIANLGLESTLWAMADKLHNNVDPGENKHVDGFCKNTKNTKIDEISIQIYMLTPGRYVGTEEVEDDGEEFGEKMKWDTLIRRRVVNHQSQGPDGGKPYLKQILKIALPPDDVQRYLK